MVAYRPVTPTRAGATESRAVVPKRRRILYVEKASGFGGSIVSLYRLTTNLDRSRYEPVILFHRPNHYVEEFLAKGLEVLVLEKSGGGPAVVGREASRNSAILKTYSPASLALRTYHVAKPAYRLIFDVLPNARALHHVIRRHSIDLVHLNDEAVANREGIVASMLAGVPCISHVRQCCQPNLLDRFLARYVDTSIYISDAVRSYWESRLPSRRSRVVYDGLALEEYLHAYDGGTVRAELGLGTSDFVVGSVGRLVEWKGHRVLLEAVALARQSIPNLKCVVVGEPDPPDDTRFLAGLRALAHDLGISHATLFLGFRADIPRILASIDLLIHSATEPEPFGLTIIEGMAAGKPVIASQAGGVLEIIQDGVNGRMVRPGDAIGTAASIVELASDRCRAGTMGEQARKSVERQFAIQAFVDQVQEVYELAFERRRGVHPSTRDE